MIKDFKVAYATFNPKICSNMVIFLKMLYIWNYKVKNSLNIYNIIYNIIQLLNNILLYYYFNG